MSGPDPLAGAIAPLLVALDLVERCLPVTALRFLNVELRTLGWLWVFDAERFLEGSAEGEPPALPDELVVVPGAPRARPRPRSPMPRAS